MPAPIIVRVGASVDSSVAATFGAIRKSANRLQTQLNQQRTRGVSQNRRAERAKISAAELSARARRDIDAKRSKAATARAQKEFRDFERAEKRKTAAVLSEARKRERAINRQAARRGERFASRTSQRASRFLTPNAPIGSLARRAASEIVRGVGVDVSAGSQLSNIIEQENQANKLSTKGFRRGAAGRAGVRQDVGRLRTDARAVAQQAGVSTGSVLEGQFAFTSQSGDLLAAEQISERLATLAASQGADLKDAFFAAGKINNALEAQPEFAGQGVEQSKKRVEEVLSVVKLLTAQTKIGSIEFDNLAKQLPKIAGLSGLFVGDTKSSLGELATVLQIAEKGQAPNAATAATQVSNLATELQKPKVQERFQEAGIDVIDEASGKAIPIRQVITQTLLKASQARQAGEVTSEGAFITNIVRNKRTFLPFFDFLDQFKQAGGLELNQAGETKGVARLDKLFTDFGRTVSEEQLAGDVAARDKLTSTRVQRFNNELEAMAEKIAVKLLPALEKAGPAFLEFVGKLGNLTTWVVENPKTAIGAAISASIARAGIESTLRAGIERAILGANTGAGAGAAGAAGVGGRAGLVGRAAGALGLGFTIAALAVTTLTVGKMILDDLLEKDRKLDEDLRADKGNAIFEKERLESKRLAEEDPARRKAFLEKDAKRRESLFNKGIAKEKSFTEAGIEGLAGAVVAAPSAAGDVTSALVSALPVVGAASEFAGQKVETFLTDLLKSVGISGDVLETQKAGVETDLKAMEAAQQKGNLELIAINAKMKTLATDIGNAINTGTADITTPQGVSAETGD